MLCDSPISIRDPSKCDSRIRLTVPCGKCVSCMKNRRSEWATRLEQELRNSSAAWFVTLTYTDENLTYTDLFPTLVKRDLQIFMKRLRKMYTQKIKYYACGEYGELTMRPHYHMILFNVPGDRLQVIEKLLLTWRLGMVHVGSVNAKSIRYTLKYMLKQSEYDYDGLENPFALMSKGLGKSYIDSHSEWHLADISRNYVTKFGQKERLPRYWRNKIYSSADRQLQNQLYADSQIQKYREKSVEEIQDDFRLEIDRKELKKKQLVKSLKNNSKI